LRYFNASPEIIRLVVMMYVRFPFVVRLASTSTIYAAPFAPYSTRQDVRTNKLDWSLDGKEPTWTAFP